MPAVCFTEMPLAAFLESSEARASRGEKMSPYAVLLRKSEAFTAGARPVIYGLSQIATADITEDGTRQFAATVLPAVEQYRYVAFNPAAGGALDWSHEREWRWPNSKFVSFLDYDEPDPGSPEHAAWRAWCEAREEDRFDGDGLCLDSAVFSNVGFLVKNERQAKLLTNEILRIVDDAGTKSTRFSFVLRHDILQGEGKLREPDTVRAVIEAATIEIQPFLWSDSGEARKMRARFFEIVRAVCEDERRDEGEFGGCWLWLFDNTHRLVRALLAAPEDDKRVYISKYGRYLVWLPELGDDRGLRLRQDLTKEIAKRVEAEFGASGTYYAVLNSDDINKVPFYTGEFPPEIYLNYAHDADDI